MTMIKKHPQGDLIARATRILAAAGYELGDVLNPAKRPKILRLYAMGHSTVKAVEEYLHASGVYGELPPKKVATALANMGLTEAQQRHFHTLGGVEWLAELLTVHDLNGEDQNGSE